MESQVKGEIHERMTNNEKRQSPEFPEIGNVGVPEFSRNGKHRKFRSFWKSNNKQIDIPQKLTGVPGCVRTVERILTLMSEVLPARDLGTALSNPPGDATGWW